MRGGVLPATKQKRDLLPPGGPLRARQGVRVSRRCAQSRGHATLCAAPLPAGVARQPRRLPPARKPCHNQSAATCWVGRTLLVSKELRESARERCTLRRGECKTGGVGGGVHEYESMTGFARQPPARQAQTRLRLRSWPGPTVCDQRLSESTPRVRGPILSNRSWALHRVYGEE
jgi:hypothetical protein